MTLPGGTILHPYGVQPHGAIQYNPDGWMTCQMAASGEGSGLFEPLSAYHGTYTVNPSRAVVTHHVAWSSSPSVSGDAVRYYRLEGDFLILTADSDEAFVEARWRKAKAT